MSGARKPRVIRPGDGTPLQVVGDVIRIKLVGKDMDLPFSVIEEETPPSGGPPLHVHSREDEWFHVLEGEFEFCIGSEAVRPKPGSYLFAPKNVPHTFKNVGAATGRVTVTISPPGFEAFFVEVDTLGKNGPPPVEKLVELAQKYGLEIPPPLPSDESTGRCA